MSDLLSGSPIFVWGAKSLSSKVPHLELLPQPFHPDNATLVKVVLALVQPKVFHTAVAQYQVLTTHPACSSSPTLDSALFSS
jgi:hypothetical protein